MIFSAPHMPYPAIFGLWKNTKNPRHSPSNEYDVALRQAIARYIEISTQLMDAMLRKIDQAFAHSGRLIVWGTGQLMYEAFRGNHPRNGPDCGFHRWQCDQLGQRVLGVKVVGPEALRPIQTIYQS